MGSINSNRKRIRGWPQMIRKLQEREARILAQKLDWMAVGGAQQYATYSLRIAPFSNLKRRNPPGWYQRLYLESMFRVYDAWKAELEARGEPYYLAVWLYDKRFTNSEVVAAVGGRIRMYSEMFKQRSPEPRFPQFAERLRDRMSWASMWDSEIYESKEWTKGRRENQFLARNHAVRLPDEKYEYYQVRYGTVWLGQK